MSRIVALLLFLGVFAFADSTAVSSAVSSSSTAAAVSSSVTDTQVPAKKDSLPATFAATDSLIASVPLNDPFSEQEKILPKDFQNLVVRAERSKRASTDFDLSINVQDFAKAAYYYYRES